MSDKFNPEEGEIWWFEPNKKHCLILAKEEPPASHRIYKWKYKYLQLEDGKYGDIYHGTMNSHGDGWFRKIH